MSNVIKRKSKQNEDMVPRSLVQKITEKSIEDYRKMIIKEVEDYKVKVEMEIVEKASLLAMGLICNVLSGEGYWEKSAKKRLPKFIEDYLSLQETYCKGILDWEEIAEMVRDTSGVTIQTDWLHGVHWKQRPDELAYKGLTREKSEVQEAYKQGYRKAEKETRAKDKENIRIVLNQIGLTKKQLKLLNELLEVKNED